MNYPVHSAQPNSLIKSKRLSASTIFRSYIPDAGHPKQTKGLYLAPLVSKQLLWRLILLYSITHFKFTRVHLHVELNWSVQLFNNHTTYDLSAFFTYMAMNISRKWGHLYRIWTVWKLEKTLTIKQKSVTVDLDI